MPKQIKVSDELYKRLKARADENYRPIGQHIEFLLDQVDKATGHPIAPIYNREDIRPVNVPVSDLFRAEEAGMPKKSEASARGKGDILADIRETEAQRDEELRYCQDAETTKKITDSYAGTISDLWNEFHLTKE